VILLVILLFVCI